MSFIKQTNERMRLQIYSTGRRGSRSWRRTTR